MLQATSRTVLYIALFVGMPLACAHAQATRTEPTHRVRPPLSPTAARAAFRVQAGYRVELAAAEPDVVDPVFVAFDERGRMWVAEMPGYPTGGPTGAGARGRIKILTDPDGDGRYELASLFADNLGYVHGLQPWRKGVIVTMAPDIVYLVDENDDGRMDRKERWYTGFSTSNPQLYVNTPTFALDNWVYAANGLRGGGVRSVRRGHGQIVSIRDRDFRFDPLSGAYEAVAGGGQYGLTFDAWGNRFICSNRNHIRHVVMELVYLERAPYLPVTRPVVDIPDHGAAAQLFTLSSNWTTSNLHRGTFTAACGLSIYIGDTLTGLRGDAFVCDPTANVVHRDRLVPRGATFVAQRVPADREFIASPDDWFRPVHTTTGPDGALYIVDMYRAVIEHPDFMPPELKNRPDLYEGNTLGRIWRVVPTEHRTVRVELPRTATDLVEALGSPNGWVRRTAQRLLVQQGRREAVPALRAALSSANPLKQLHALWTLAGMHALQESDLLRTLRAKDPHVVENAIRVAERFGMQWDRVRGAVRTRLRHPAFRVRYQAVLTSGLKGLSVAVDEYAGVLLQDPKDRWLRLAVATACSERGWQLLNAVVQDERWQKLDAGARKELVELLGLLLGGKAEGAELRAVAETRPPGLKPQEYIMLLSGLAEGLLRRRQSPRRLFGAPWAQAATTAALSAATSLDSATAPSADTLRTVRLLSWIPAAQADELLVRWIRQEHTHTELRVAAIQALGARSSSAAASVLLERWKAMLPAERRAAAGVLLRRRQTALRLLEAIERGEVLPGELDKARLQQLRNYPAADVRSRAASVLARLRPADREAVLRRYRKALQLKGDFQRGKTLFREKCATCHRVAGLGADVGPDISDTRIRSPESLLTDILDPNRAIDANYVNYVVLTTDGQVFSGIIAGESATAITLVRGANEKQTILKEHIESIRSTGQSLMPEGFEQELTPQDLADLIFFLKNWRYLERSKEPGAPPVPGVNR